MTAAAVRPKARAQARRLGRSAWALLHEDSSRSALLAEQALDSAGDDPVARGWALLTHGFQQLFFATPAEAVPVLDAAQAAFTAAGDAAGRILAGSGLARAAWRAGRFADALELALSLRGEGLRVLRGEQRGVLLNAIAGCYSAQGRSDLAFAYMYEALRDAAPTRGPGHGLDAVLHCNLAHELLQIGDCHEALRHVDSGIQRCRRLNNPRLASVLWINRVIGLTELDRTQEAIADIHRICELPADASGRGRLASHFETLAIAALRAGETALGAELVARAEAAYHADIPDEHVELAVARALLAQAGGRLEDALAALQPGLGLAGEPPAPGLSHRVRCLYLLTRADLLERLGDAAGALAAMRQWQHVHLQRSALASRARYQAAALQTELLRLQQQVDEHDARRREIEAVNAQLSRRVAEVQALQERLRQQATRDELTGLFNRRHLNETLPQMLALARRERQPLAVAIIDLDHFKAVNDRHGHASGDRLLAAFGRLLATNSRRSDVACRYGGEEFCLLMPRTDALAARRKVAALLRRWRAECFDLGGARLDSLSFSAGVADSERCPGCETTLLKAADDELLAAKRQGRNRVFAADGPPPDVPAAA
ncbi:GGDEF domain-containing protein [Rubrivivax gelatinosus]|uniref:tetratricopeptide repeat-containing diguanylate cyclase n=1 Tax=Rubrivivax gelatinosus TaxID=28068 RepID=UPI0019067E21|nr:tetratricopeptide repeat-containing diguanylate cyclase [Rubrivivax gelatinosus]MBK1615781.1 GGDEF domain-containing protein [Rubrivivax gelatinosus]